MPSEATKTTLCCVSCFFRAPRFLLQKASTSRTAASQRHVYLSYPAAIRVHGAAAALDVLHGVLQVVPAFPAQLRPARRAAIVCRACAPIGDGHEEAFLESHPLRVPGPPLDERGLLLVLCGGGSLSSSSHRRILPAGGHDSSDSGLPVRSRRGTARAMLTRPMRRHLSRPLSGTSERCTPPARTRARPYEGT